MRLTLWPQSLFGRLMAASIIALLLAQIVSLILLTRERERFILQGSVREWSRRIAEVSTMLQGMDKNEREPVVAKLSERPWRFGRHPAEVMMFRNGLMTAAPELDRVQPPPPGEPAPVRPPMAVQPPLDGPPMGDGIRGDSMRGDSNLRLRTHPGRRALDAGPAGPPPPEDSRNFWVHNTTVVIPFTEAGDLEEPFEEELRSLLGGGFSVDVKRTADASQRAIFITGPFFSDLRDPDVEMYDAAVKFPDGYSTTFRVSRSNRGTPLPRGVFLNLMLLVIVMSVALWVVARSITRPLSELARAADSVGRNLRQPKIAERGAREVRNAARAFNTMQDRMQRYLDSRSRVLAAMSHDLKTPLTRLRLQVEMLDDPAAQTRIGKQLDEMESMVHGSLALFRGLDDNEAFTPVDINEMLETLSSEFAEMSSSVSLEGQANRSILGKPQALRRCLTNLIANAIKFGGQAHVLVEDGSALVIRIQDEGPGVPEDQLERVFEPFYRVESSRNRDTGGSGLGLSIARDVIQAHGGTLILHNLPVRGLEATLTLPRA